MEETEFLFDEELERKQLELEKSQKQLKFLIKKMQNPRLEKQARFLKDFTRAMILQYKKPKKLTKEQEQKKLLIEHAKHKLRTTRLIMKPRLRRPKPMQKILPVQHQTIAPVKQTQEKIKEIKKQVKKELIIDKFTKKTLATANIDSKYNVQEPNLDEDDKKALNKIIKKQPKNMKKAWNLILRYKKKFKLKEGHEDNLKYYAVNRLFTMGKIEPLLHDEDVTQIKCRGVAKPIIVMRKGKEYPTNLSFKDVNELETFIEILRQRTEQKLDKKHPTLDTTHRNFHVHATLGINIANSKFILKRI